MSDLEFSTLTFFMTDIQGSTKLWESYPEPMRRALARHDEILQAAVEGNGGKVVKSKGEGDALFAVFGRPSDAASAAAAAQRALSAESWPATLEIKVRIGIHLGPVQVRDGDYFGTTVNRCARLKAIAHGGQVLLSEAAAVLVQGESPAGITLRSLGEHRLKDLTQPEHIFQLVAPDIPVEFPPVRSLSVLSNNLPIQTTRFIGREAQLAEVSRLLAGARLVTLAGAGGSGKTRLALQTAADLMEEYPDGVWLVEMASLSAPGQIPLAIADVLGVREEHGRSLEAVLIDHLRPRHTLLVLDNSEHLVKDCARIADMILRGCQMVTILATSREVLQVPGEVIYRVPTLAEDEAIRLFVDRATATQPAFRLTPENAPVIASICHRLDGIPLALELAAARVRVLSVQDIDARLNDRFRLLTGGNRTSLPRQQTLRGLIDWSHEMLSDQEKALFRRLSVFAGGFELEAAESVCSGEDMEEWEVLDLLTQLVDKSLVISEERESKARYRLLESLREYGAAKLRDAGEELDLRRRHLQWYLKVALEAEKRSHGGGHQPASFNQLEREHDNMRSALLWCHSDPESLEAGLQMAGALDFFWRVRGYISDAKEQVLGLLGLSDPASASVGKATALVTAANLTRMQENGDEAASYATDAVAAARQVGDKTVLGRALLYLGWADINRKAYEQALTSLEEARELFGAVRDLFFQAETLAATANALRMRGELDQAETINAEALSLRRKIGDLHGVAVALRGSGWAAAVRKEPETAYPLFREALELIIPMHDLPCTYYALLGLAYVAGARGRHERVMQLWGAAESIRKAAGITAPPRKEAAMAAREAEQALGAAEAERLGARGMAMGFAEATAFALGEE